MRRGDDGYHLGFDRAHSLHQDARGLLARDLRYLSFRNEGHTVRAEGAPGYPLTDYLRLPSIHPSIH